RKNYLFAGSHDAAQRSAVIYTFFANCQKHEIDPYKWLKYTLENIREAPIQDIQKFYPQNFKK
uniref:transposase domain-containing protein n=1 Tax=uncultured Microscilla sp. TaxID=432653 RepID=UPI003456E1F4